MMSPSANRQELTTMPTMYQNSDMRGSV